MKKWICMGLAVLCCLSLCACKNTQNADAPEVPEQITEAPEKKEDVSQQTQPEKQADWRQETVFSVIGTIKRDGETIPVLCLMDDEGLSIYYDEAEQTLFDRLEIGEAYEGAADAITEYDFMDLDDDGNSDPTLVFSFSDGTSARLTWFYTEGEGYVLNREFSTLRGMKWETPYEAVL